MELKIKKKTTTEKFDEKGNLISRVVVEEYEEESTDTSIPFTPTPEVPPYVAPYKTPWENPYQPFWTWATNISKSGD